jgi:hypothetical protein
MQVQQLTEQLQQLKDAELARRLQSQQLDLAAQQALDRQLARVLSEQEGGSTSDLESTAGSLHETVLPEEQQELAATVALAATVSHGGAGCGALVTDPAGTASKARVAPCFLLLAKHLAWHDACPSGHGFEPRTHGVRQCTRIRTLASAP